VTSKAPSIRIADFDRMVPNGTWVRQLEGAAPRGVTLPVEGVLMSDHVDETRVPAITSDSRLTVTALTDVVPIRVFAGEMDYKIDDEWISFRELCIRAIEQRLKDGMGMTTERIGTALFSVASWIESQGNKGYSDEEIMLALPTFPIRLLGMDYRRTWENILFFGDGGRRDDFNGWGVHKRTPAHWTITWLARFGPEHPQADQLMNDTWDEAQAEYAKRAVKRAQSTCAGVDLEQELTRDVAHKAASMWLMSHWAQHRAWKNPEARDAWKLQSALYHDAYKVFRQELVYRQDQQPQPRRSKKKTQAARDDWATASRYFDRRVGFGFDPGLGFDPHLFYTTAYLNACCESDAVPDVSIDYENLPRGIPGEAPDGADTTIDTDEAEV
jgi:hypothetical protein